MAKIILYGSRALVVGEPDIVAEKVEQPTTSSYWILHKTFSRW